ncbi:uncharacterized protein L201_003870 [Kwoniella dendrophila CBS 6074]|uniref:Beta-lactamase-related domain-containing protein n=1 Tax=Kwoniella dendrophila CBS 6074 TaxID=1295534 RepID=A0AAX4JWM5_9TREE
MTNLEQIMNESFEEDIRAAMNKWSVQGCAIVVTKGEEYKIITLGKRDESEPVTCKTLFALASCSKLFTALALIRALTSEGLNVKTRIKTILPDFKLYDKLAEEECTIEDMLSHRTGLPGYDPLWNPSYSLDDLPDRLSKLKPTLGFREGQQYNSFLYDLAVLIIEKLTNQHFEKYIQSEFFDPLGMESVTFEHDEEGKEYSKGFWKGFDPNAAQQEIQEEGKVEILDFGLRKLGERGGLGTGRLWINGDDLVKWLKALPDIPEYKQCIKPINVVGSSGGLEFPDHTILYGLAQRISTHRGVLVNEHSGEIPGFLSRISRLPKYNVGFAILTNSDPGGKYLRSLVKCKLIEAFAGLEKLDWIEKIESIHQEHLDATRKWLSPSSSFSGNTIKGKSNDDPLIGTWKSEGFDTWEITPSSIVNKLPSLKSLPFIPALYGQVNYFFSPSNEKGKYHACFEWQLDSIDSKEIIYGYPFSVQLIDYDRIKVIGLMGVGEGLNEDDFGIIFERL